MPSRSHSSSVTCGAYGWSRETAVSAANRASALAVSRDSSFTSSMTAEIAVLNANRRPMSSVAFAIVSCVFRASGPFSGDPAGGFSATSLTTRHRRRTNRAIASADSSVHSMS